jgi:predicted nucleotidyltransferase
MYTILFDCCEKYYDNIAWRFPVCPGEVEKVILYGSRARGDNRPDSDMDIL